MPLHKRSVFARLILRRMELVLCCADCACSRYFLVRSGLGLTIPHIYSTIAYFSKQWILSKIIICVLPSLVSNRLFLRSLAISCLVHTSPAYAFSGKKYKYPYTTQLAIMCSSTLFAFIHYVEFNSCQMQFTKKFTTNYIIEASTVRVQYFCVYTNVLTLEICCNCLA